MLLVPDPFGKEPELCAAVYQRRVHPVKPVFNYRCLKKLPLSVTLWKSQHSMHSTRCTNSVSWYTAIATYTSAESQIPTL